MNLITLLVLVHCFSLHMFNAGTNEQHTTAVPSCKYLFKRFWLECSEILTQNQFHIFHIPIWMRWCVCWAGNIAFQYQIANTSKLTAGYSLVSCNPWIKIIHLFVCWHGFMWLRQFLSLGLFVMSCLKIK